MMDDRKSVARQGDGRQAFEEIVQRYTPVVYSSARRQVRDRMLAEDVTQAVFLVLWKKWGGVRGELLTGWLLRATWFASRQAIRAKQRREGYERRAAAMRGQMAEVAWESYAGEIDEALALLGEADRSAVALRYLQGLPLREVGERMGLSEEAARKRVDRGIAKLRGLVARKAPAPAVAGLAAALVANGVEAAPAGLAEAAIAVSNSVRTGTAGAIAKGTMKMMAWSKAQSVAMVVALILLSSGVGAIVYGETAQPNASTTAERREWIATTQAATAPPGTQPAAGPKETCLAAYAALQAGDEEAFLSYCHNPTSQRAQMIRTLVRVVSGLTEVARAAEARFGKQEAAALSQLAGFGVMQGDVARARETMPAIRPWLICVAPDPARFPWSESAHAGWSAAASGTPSMKTLSPTSAPEFPSYGRLPKT